MRSLSLYRYLGSWCRMADNVTLKAAVICERLYVHLRQYDDVNVKLVSCLFKMPSNLLCIYLFYTSLDEWTYRCIQDIVLLCCSRTILVICSFLEGFFVFCVFFMSRPPTDLIFLPLILPAPITASYCPIQLSAFLVEGPGCFGFYHYASILTVAVSSKVLRSSLWQCSQ